MVYGNMMRKVITLQIVLTPAEYCKVRYYKDMHGYNSWKDMLLDLEPEERMESMKNGEKNSRNI